MTDQPNFTLTPLAIQEVKAQKEKRGTSDVFLRLGVRGGACSGFQYVVEWEDYAPKETDHIFEFDGARIVIDPKSMVFLNGASLDWEKTLMKSGFKFINPKETSKCGCGLSVGFEK